MDESLKDIIKVEDIKTEEEYIVVENGIAMFPDFVDPLALRQQESSQNGLKREAG